MGEALSRLGARGRWLWGVTAVLFAMAPTPGRVADARRVTLWPAPLIWLEAPRGAPGSPRPLDLGSLSVVSERRAPWRFSSYALLERARRESVPTRELGPGTFAGDRGALLFYSGVEEAPARFRAIPLGNLLHKQVAYLPIYAFAELWPLVQVDEVGPLAGHTLYRARLAEGRDRWILAARVASPAAQTVRRRAASRAPAAGAAEASTKARRLADALEGRHVVLYAGEQGLERWQALLPLFLRRTPELVVVEPARAAEVRRTLGPGRPAGEVAGVPLAEHRLFDWDWVVAGER